jgi:hypothetical protein
LCSSSSIPRLPDPEVLSAVFFLGAKFRQNAKNKDKMGILSRTIPISRNFLGFFFFLEIFLPHLDSAFNLVGVF